MPNPTAIGKGFNRLAFIYDFVVWLVFGNRMITLKKNFLAGLPKAESALIVGGGTGKILELALDCNLATHVVYAELSEAMMAKTKQRLYDEHRSRVTFCDDYSSQLSAKKYDYIILPFVLDCYRNRDIKPMIEQFSLALKTEGNIVVFDFNLNTEDGFKHRPWKVGFIKLLYIFFRFTTSIPARRLPSFGRLFNESGYYKARTASISKGWIQATAWKRENRNTTTA